ncbi:MAG: hypothetical protein ACXWFN_08685, partial [Solirubrobacterales bacterium]
MGRDLLRGRSGLAELLGRLLVAELALARRQVRVDGRTHQRVDEAQWRLVPQDLGVGEHAAHLRRAGGLDPGERGDCREIDSVAEDGRGSRHRDRVGV